MYVVVRQPKSVGISLLLTFLFGPLGLFYASVTGGFIMTFGPLALLVYLFLAQSGVALFAFISGILIYALLGWLICIIWAITAVNSYNRKLILGATPNSTLLASEEESPTYISEVNDEHYKRNKAKREITVFISIVLIGTLVYFLQGRNKQNKEEVAEWSAQSDGPVYTSPNIKSDIVTQVKEGQSVEVISETVYFLKIKLVQEDGITKYGFVKKTLLKYNGQSTLSPNQDNASNLNLNDIVTPALADETKSTPQDDNAVLLSDEESRQEQINDVDEKLWQVITPKAYFHERTNTKSIRNAYLVKGNNFRSKVESDGFVHAEFINSKGKHTSGYILKKNLVSYNNETEVLQDSIE